VLDEAERTVEQRDVHKEVRKGTACL